MEQWQLSAGMFITSRRKGMRVMASDDPEARRKQRLMTTTAPYRPGIPSIRLCVLSHSLLTTALWSRFSHYFPYSWGTEAQTARICQVIQPINGQTHLCAWVVSESPQPSLKWPGPVFRSMRDRGDGGYRHHLQLVWIKPSHPRWSQFSPPSLDCAVDSKQSQACVSPNSL